MTKVWDIVVQEYKRIPIAYGKDHVTSWAYHEGITKPNHPVPAIPMRVEWRTDNGKPMLFETYPGGEVAIYRPGNWEDLFNW